MKKNLKTGFLFTLIFAITIVYGIYKNQEDQIDVSKIYTISYQETCAKNLESEKGNESYSLYNVFYKYNPFSTNTQSMYIYFMTDKAASISYTISAKGYADYTNTAYQTKKYQKEHEFQLIGLLPNTTNTIILKATYKDGTSETSTFTYKMSSLLSNVDIQLQTTTNTKANLGNGLYTILGNDSDTQDFVYMYDTNGILRCEIPILGYRSQRILFQDQTMYMSISSHKICAMNHLGQVTKIYNLGKFELHHDYQFDANGNLIVLATDTNKNTKEDCVVKVDLKNGKVNELLDLEDIFDSYKESTTYTKGREWDWMHINTVQYLKDDSVILSSRETSSILKISNISTNPTLEYIIGNEDFWQNSEFSGYLYNKDGDFLTSGGQHTVTYQKDDSLEEGQYYLYMFDNNFGFSRTRPDYEWSVNDGIETSSSNGKTSYYYKYLVDENKQTYTLVQSFKVPYSAYVSSVQQVDNHIVVDSGMAGLLSIYDTDGNLEEQFSIKKNKKYIYRIYYYDYSGYYSF
jgi:arylsulfate sulfotransferase